MRSILQFFHRHFSKKIIIFGVGASARNYLDLIPCEVAYCVDNNPEFWGETINKLEIKTPAILVNEKEEELCILVMSSFYSEISKQLISMGFLENQHFFNGYKMIGAICSSKQQIHLEYPVNSVPRYGYGKPPHKELFDIINRNKDFYRSNLSNFRQYTDKLKEIQVTLEDPCSTEPVWSNNFLSGLDAMSLYCFLDMYKPKTYMEIGSGNSTKFAKKSIRDNKLGTRIISIDPCPRAEIDGLCDKVIRLPLEDVDAEIFSELEENDILFFDGSHRSFMNSDVSAFFLDIIPKLKSGVLVHIHDVFLPFDYPAVWKERYYSEQYLLACYMLAESQKFQVVFPSCFIAVDTELSLELSPLWRVLDSRILKTGASFWLKII